MSSAPGLEPSGPMGDSKFLSYLGWQRSKHFWNTCVTLELGQLEGCTPGAHKVEIRSHFKKLAEACAPFQGPGSVSPKTCFLELGNNSGVCSLSYTQFSFK